LKKNGSEDNRIAKAQIYLQRKVNAGDLASIATFDGITWNGVARELKRASKVQINSNGRKRASVGEMRDEDEMLHGMYTPSRSDTAEYARALPGGLIWDVFTLFLSWAD
jgi:hypothetical protein